MRLAAWFLASIALVPALAKDGGDFVKQHLNSIGTEEARSAVKSRATEGTATFEIENANSGRLEGKAFWGNP
jgi:hypothetical protein